VFSLLALKVTRRIRRWNTLQPLWRTLLVAAVCGLAVAIIGIVSGGLTFGKTMNDTLIAVPTEGQSFKIRWETNAGFGQFRTNGSK